MNMMFTLSRKKNTNSHKNYWTLKIGCKHSIWEFLFLFNMKPFKTIRKYCSKKIFLICGENWNLFTVALFFSVIFKRKIQFRLAKQMGSYDASNYQNFYSRENFLICTWVCGCFSGFVCDTKDKVLIIKKPTKELSGTIMLMRNMVVKQEIRYILQPLTRNKYPRICFSY